MAKNLKSSKITVKMLMKKCTIYYFIFGVIIGVIMLLYSFSNNDFKWNIIDRAYYGVTAGLFALLFMPFVMGIVGFFHSFMLWYPIVWFYRKVLK